MVEISKISKLQQPLLEKGQNISKTVLQSNAQSSEIKSLYDNNGLSRAVISSRMPAISFGAHLDTADVSKLVNSFKSLDPNVQKFVDSLSEVFKSDKYQAMNEAEKKIFSAVAVVKNYLTQIGKPYFSIDKNARSAIASFTQDERLTSRVHGLVDNSDIVRCLNKRPDPSIPLNSNDYKDFAILKDYGIKFRKACDIDIAKTLMEKGLYGDCDPSVHSESMDALKTFVSKQIHKNGIWLPVSEIPSASDIKKLPIKIGSGDNVTENVVVDLFNDNLGKLGFKKGLTKESFSTIGHAVDSERFSPGLIDIVTEEGTDALLSASYFQDGKFSTFGERQFGLFFDSHPSNIALADNSNMGSGFAKDYIDFTNNLLSQWKTERVTFAKNMKEILNIGEEEYSQIYAKHLSSAKSLDDITDLKIKNAAIEAVNKTVMNPNGGMNEIVVYSPSLMAVFSKASNIEDIPYKLRKFAQDKNIPIVDISKFTQ